MIAPSAAGMAETVSSAGPWSRSGTPPSTPSRSGRRSAARARPTSASSAPATPASGPRTSCARADPALDVVVLEAETAGFGASGRNGGWVLGRALGSARALGERGGRAGAIAQARAIAETVDEVGRVVAAEGIDCDFVKGGSLHVAQTPLELERVVAEVEESRAWEGDDELLDAAATARAGRRGRRARRLLHAALRAGPAGEARARARATRPSAPASSICEGTRATRIAPGRVDTPYGIVRAPHVVRATEGYTAGLPGLRRLLLPLTSSMIVTEPLGDDAWAEIGWERCETLLDGLRRYAYLQRTADGRIAIGGRGVPYRFGSSTDREGPLDPATVARAADAAGGAVPGPARRRGRRRAGTACSASRATGRRRSASTRRPGSRGRAATSARASPPRTSPAARCATSCSDAPPSSPRCRGSGRSRAAGSPSRCASPPSTRCTA